MLVFFPNYVSFVPFFLILKLMCLYNAWICLCKNNLQIGDMLATLKFCLVLLKDILHMHVLINLGHIVGIILFVKIESYL